MRPLRPLPRQDRMGTWTLAAEVLKWEKSKTGRGHERDPAADRMGRRPTMAVGLDLSPGWLHSWRRRHRRGHVVEDTGSTVVRMCFVPAESHVEI